MPTEDTNVNDAMDIGAVVVSAEGRKAVLDGVLAQYHDSQDVSVLQKFLVAVLESHRNILTALESATTLDEQAIFGPYLDGLEQLEIEFAERVKRLRSGISGQIGGLR